MQKVFILIFRLLLGTIFFVSAAAKFLSLSAFETALRSFGLIPTAALPFFIYLIPTLELLLAFAFFRPQFANSAALFAAITLLFFMAAASSVLISGVEIANCGCFGDLYHSSLGWGFFVRNGILLLMSLGLIWINEAQANPTQRNN